MPYGGRLKRRSDHESSREYGLPSRSGDAFITAMPSGSTVVSTTRLNPET